MEVCLTGSLAGENRKPTRLSLGWVDSRLDVCLSSRSGHPLTRVGPQQQQQQPQQQSIELETVRIMVCFKTLVPPRALNASVGAVSLRVAVVDKVRRRVLDVKSGMGGDGARVFTDAAHVAWRDGSDPKVFGSGCLRRAAV